MLERTRITVEKAAAEHQVPKARVRFAIYYGFAESPDLIELLAGKEGQDHSLKEVSLHDRH